MILLRILEKVIRPNNKHYSKVAGSGRRGDRVQTFQTAFLLFCLLGICHAVSLVRRVHTDYFYMSGLYFASTPASRCTYTRSFFLFLLNQRSVQDQILKIHSV
jgi:hypothetical protein